MLMKKGFGRCSHCGLDGIHAKKDGTAYQHCYSRVNGKNVFSCLGSGQPLEDVMWFETTHDTASTRLGVGVAKNDSLGDTPSG